VAIIQPFSAELQARLRACGRPCTLAKNELLFCSGSAPTAVFQITHGQIRLSATAESGKEAVLSVMGKGEWIGEMSLFLDDPRTHDARAVVDSEVLVVPRERFRAVVDDNPAYLLELLHLLSWRYRSALQWIDRFIMLPFPVRLARRLLFEHAKRLNETGARLPPVGDMSAAERQMAAGETTGRAAHKTLHNPTLHNPTTHNPTTHKPAAHAPADQLTLAEHMTRAVQTAQTANQPDPSTAALRLSQQDLADMLGVSRQSINKQLKRWEQQGWVRLSYGRISLLNAKALAGCAGA
jgi:CRP-like cAMP-binding protein